MTELSADKYSELLHTLQHLTDEVEIRSCFKALQLAQQKVTNRKAMEVLDQLQLDSRVQFTGGKPQYLKGARGTVIDIKDKRAHIKLDSGPVGKFRNGVVVAPFSLLRVIS